MNPNNIKRRVSYSSLFLLALALVLNFSFLTSYAQDKNGNSLLWKISGKGLSKPSYLYGTIHLLCQSDMVMGDAVKNALKESEQVVMELDMDDPNTMLELQKGAMITGGKTIKELTKPEDYTLMKTFFKDSLQIDLDQAGMIKPLFLMAFVYTKFLNCPIASYETTFTQLAAEQKKQITGLETPQYQLGVFDKIPTDKQLDWILEMVKDYKKTKDEFTKITASYKANDLNKTMEALNESMVNEKEYEGILLTDRNKNWIPDMEKSMKEKGTFFAVGAGHLGGSEGVLELLRKQGYTVTAVK